MPKEPIFNIVIFGIAIFMLIGIFLLVMLYIFNKRQVQFKLERKLLEARHQETLLKSQLEIQEETLNNISAEIHDNIIQLLSLSKLKMNSILDLASGEIKETADQTKELLSSAISDLRTLSHHLNGDYIMQEGLQPAIRSTFSSLGNSTSLKTSFSQRGEAWDLGGKREIVIFRIFQEVLNNCIKHSGASNFSVELVYDPDEFIIELVDDGKGFNAISPETKGIGLKNIENRASLINARYQLHTTPMKGTRIRITIQKN